MKRLRCSGLLALLFAVTGGSGLHAQGSAFLLRPVGARAVGLGQAVVARRDGSEGMWWNPASLAGSTRREMSIHHSQDFFATGDALTLVVPASRLGVFAIAADLQNYGEQENTTDPTVPATGTVLTQVLRALRFMGHVNRQQDDGRRRDQARPDAGGLHGSVRLSK